MDTIRSYPDDIRQTELTPASNDPYVAPTRRVGLFPASALGGHAFEGKDFAGLIAAVVITLGPLAAYSLGLGA